MNKSFRHVVVAILGASIILFATFTAPAQLTRGAISGTVHDASGATIPGASVKATSNTTNVTRTVTTDDNGFYRIGALEPGTYTVEIEKTGFSKISNKNLELNTASEVTFDVDLKVGNVTESVDVTADTEAVTLNKTNGTVGTTIDSRRAVELPLGAARNINNLALLSPNVFSGPGSSGISANGQRARNNNFTIDGSDNNDLSVTISTTPVIAEAVSEFQIQTNPYSAESGRNTGASINVITKSGTNNYHGSAWDYYQGSGLNALDNIEKAGGLTRPARYNRNQFGFNVGGPLPFFNFGEGGPFFRDGKDRTFFFYLFQGDLNRTGALQAPTIRIPTPAGFAALSTVPLRAGQSAASRQAVLNQLAFLQEVYAQNPQFLSQSVSNIIANGVAIQTAQTNLGITQPVNTYNHTVRIDHKIGQSDNLTGRYIENRSNQTNVVSTLGFGNRFSGAQVLKDKNLAISETHVFNSNVLNEFRFSYIRRDLDFPENDTVTPTTTIGGLVVFGGANNFPQSRITDNFQFADTVTYTAGRHTFKFGADIRRNILANFSGFDVKGTFGFSNLQDYLNNNAATFTQAFSVADFDAKQTQQFYFVQDDWRATPSLTLNLGLRYEFSNVPLGFLGTTDPVQLAGLVPGPVKADKNNIAPIFGFAYSPRFSGNGLLAKTFGDGLTVVRGGFRTAYDVLFFNILTATAASNFPITTSSTQTNVLDVYPTLAPATSTPVLNLANGFANAAADLKNPESYLYSLSVQREIARQIVLEVGYTGSHSINQIAQGQANPAVLTDAQIQTVLVSKNANSIPTAQQRRLFPQFGPRTLIISTAQGTYNAGYLSFKKRLANNFLFDVAYTFSKLIDNNSESLNVAGLSPSSPQVPQDYFKFDQDRSLSAFDRTHRFVINYLYEVPLPGSLRDNAVTKALLGGFQISGITSFQSGQPFTIVTGVDSNGNGTATGDRPNFNPSGTLTLDPVTGNFRTFTSPLVGGRFTVPLGTNNLPLANSLGNGNLGKNTFRAPGFWNTSLSFAKRIVLPWGGEDKHSFIVRADLSNAFNQDNYGIPVNNMNSADFGKNINNWGNRIIILSGKYSF